MKDAEIERRLAEQDKDQQHYTDMKIRAVRKQIPLFIWMGKYPRKAVLGLFLFVLMCISVANIIDIRKFVANKFGIEFKQ